MGQRGSTSKKLDSEKFECNHDGCTKKLNKGDLNEHEINCEFRVISCPLSSFKECSEKIRIKDAKKHLIANHADQTLSLSSRKFIQLGFECESLEPTMSLFMSLSGQNVFLIFEYIESDDDENHENGLCWVHAFLVDAPTKAANLTFQVKGKKNKSDWSCSSLRSGPMNAIDEPNPRPCFHMNFLDEEHPKFKGACSYNNFRVVDKTPPKPSIFELVYQKCKKILKKFK